MLANRSERRRAMRPRTSKPLVGILGDVDGRIVPVAPPPVSEFESGSSMPVRPSAVFELAPTGLDSNPDTMPDRLRIFRSSESAIPCPTKRRVSHVSLAVVLVMAAEPGAGLVATEWRAVEPLVHAPEAVDPARVRRVGVVHDAILERERAHAGPFSPVGRPVRSYLRRPPG